MARDVAGAIAIDGREAAASKLLANWRAELREREAAPATVEKYVRVVSQFLEFVRGGDAGCGGAGGGAPALVKTTVIAFKEQLRARYAPTTVNTMLAAVNGFLRSLGHSELCVRRLRVQALAARAPERELSEDEYRRLVRTALDAGDECMALALQTMGATGIRVSELSFVTAEAVRAGRVVVQNKGKVRQVWLPVELCRRLEGYASAQHVESGPVFVTRTGRPLDRTQVWRRMKRYGRAAGIDTRKVFPHNLRHLFALVFYRVNRDIDSLSHVLGHARLETTRIYLATDEEQRRRQVNRLNLLL